MPAGVPSPSKIRLRFLTLSFPDPELERAFQLADARNARSRHRIAWVATAVIWALLGLVDPFTGGTAANVHVIHLIRFSTLPVMLAVAVVGWLSLESFARWRHVAAAVGALTGVWSVVAMAALVPDPSTVDMRTGPMGFAIGLIAVCFIWSTRLAVSAVIAIPVTLTATLLVFRYPAPSDAVVVLWLYMAAVLGGVGTWRFEVNRRYAFLLARSLEAERARSEALLENLLPPVIAARLKDNPSRIAEHHDAATILFCDIVGFTPLSAQMEPTALAETLDAIFSSFDDLAHRLGLEKIKTIGDAYMVAGGLPSPRPDHAEAVAEMALGIRERVAQMSSPAGGPIQVRIGIHSGPVVAGVIGKKKLVYDLWGDTVNTASRMESHGAEGCIHVSRATFELLEKRYRLSARGTIQVKGKGAMETFFLEGRRDEAQGRENELAPVASK